MKTIKIIDLFIKIANGEEVPQKIKYCDKCWIYEKRYQDYDYKKDGYTDGILLQDLFRGYDNTLNILNFELEIIEEEKEIEKIKSNGIEFYSDYINAWIKKEETVAYCEYLMNKINELIDAVNELKRNK